MIRAALLAALSATLLGGCTIPIVLPDGKVCREERGIGFVGQRYTPRIAKVVKGKTQSVRVRAIMPDTMVTQEFDARRVNLVVDAKNRVTRIYCG